MNNGNEVDLLQIRIENAKAKLPSETINAIAAIDWKAVILSMREKKGYSFEQLGDLELETELLLCGLTTPEEYPKELETRMKISRAETSELVNEMNKLVFNKIKEELIKNSERKKIFEKRTEKTETQSTPNIPKTINAYIPKADQGVLKTAGIEMLSSELELPAPSKEVKENREEILKKVENPEPIRPLQPVAKNVHPLFAEKILTSVQTPVTKTDHAMENITKNTDIGDSGAVKTPRVDPYREIPE